MRKFIDPNGNYSLMIPSLWGYSNPLHDYKTTDPESFELYDNPVGCFQISCNPSTKGKIPELIKNNSLAAQQSGKENLDFVEKYIPSPKFDMYLWFALVDNKFMMCKYIYDAVKRDTEEIKKEVQSARNCLKTVKVIKEESKKEVLAYERFLKFMNSLAASVDLKNRAYENGSSIELVVLLASQIDALLRLTLILKKQIDNSTDEIDTTLIFQDEGDKPILEKKVYQMSLAEGIISQNLNNKLVDLYNQRNKVIHRYIITDLLTNDVMRIAIDYSFMEEEVSEILESYEKKQFQIKVGIYGTSAPATRPISQEIKNQIIGAIREKHANRKINDNITFK